MVWLFSGGAIKGFGAKAGAASATYLLLHLTGLNLQDFFFGNTGAGCRRPMWPPTPRCLPRPFQSEVGEGGESASVSRVMTLLTA
ncbi:hypothetical protein GCM10018966_092640 [Streptomyces yanii]